MVRFRPIMMTTMAALFGTLAIALGLGAGAKARCSLGLAVVGVDTTAALRKMIMTIGQKLFARLFGDELRAANSGGMSISFGSVVDWRRLIFNVINGLSLSHSTVSLLGDRKRASGSVRRP